MQVVFVSSESVPYAKIGGLADVSGALSRILKKKGINIINFLPFYKQIDKVSFKFEMIKENLDVPDFEEKFNLLKCCTEQLKLTTYFIQNKKFFKRDEIYNNYSDNPSRFIFFSKAVLKSLKFINFKPDIIHCHDWHTSTIPIVLKTKIYMADFFKNVKILLTIHNLAFQGIGKKNILQKLGLDDSYFTSDKLEFHGKVNLLKGGIIYSDLINTVSETYAKEIQTEELGFGLKKELISRKEHLFGILNGIDYDIWDPKIDKFIWKNYSLNTLEDKEYNKKKLKELLNLTLEPIPLVAMISRLTSQKGFDLLLEIFEKIMELDLQLVILGTGQPKYHEIFKKLAKKYPKRFALRLEFNNELAHQIEAGADIFLMPSSFEPCGLNQMISLKYGTIPIVYKTGGLADTVKDIKNYEDGNGFIFKDYKSEKMYDTIKAALKSYNEKFWLKLQKNAMKCDFSWDMSANKYIELYNKLINLKK